VDVGRKGFLICPVRGVTPEEHTAIEKYVAERESAGWTIHWPSRDTDQNDPVGLRICMDNRAAIKASTAIHVWWNGKSSGSIFDFGMTFDSGIPIILANAQALEALAAPGKKSFENVLLAIGLVRREPGETYARLRTEKTA